MQPFSPPPTVSRGVDAPAHATAEEALAHASVWAIVLMYGGESVTAACIDSLLTQDYPRLTVLLVDNASEDGAGDRLRHRYPGIEYLATGANLGYAGGNNRGIDMALGRGADYVLILNNDTVLDPACVSTLAASAAKADRLGAVAPKILFYDDPSRIWYAGGDFSYLRAIGTHRRELERDDAREEPRLEEITFVSGCCLMIPAHVVRQVGGFRDDFFMYCEDVEWSLRVRRAGWRMYYQPAARMLHRQGSSKGLASAFAALHRDRNRRRLVREHYTWWQRLAFGLWFYPTRAIRSVQYLLGGDAMGARAIVAAALGSLRPGRNA